MSLSFDELCSKNMTTNANETASIAVTTLSLVHFRIEFILSINKPQVTPITHEFLHALGKSFISRADPHVEHLVISQDSIIHMA